MKQKGADLLTSMERVEITNDAFLWKHEELMEAREERKKIYIYT
jgi:hypothetical protein